MAWARGFCCPADSDLGDPDGSDCHAFGGQMACVDVCVCVCVCMDSQQGNLILSDPDLG